MANNTIQWPKRQYNGQKDNTMANNTIQWPKRQYNGQKDNTMAKKEKDKWTNNTIQNTAQ
jgi:hypothetical protein